MFTVMLPLRGLSCVTKESDPYAFWRRTKTHTPFMGAEFSFWSFFSRFGPMSKNFTFQRISPTNVLHNSLCKFDHCKILLFEMMWFGLKFNFSRLKEFHPQMWIHDWLYKLLNTHVNVHDSIFDIFFIFKEHFFFLF